jgi:hypothetical protein
MERSTGIGALLRRMEGLLEPLEASRDPGRFFLATCLRTTRAVAEELHRGGFRDPEWVERWDVAFADLYLDAVEDAQAGRRPPEPWAVAFAAGHGADGLPPLRHVLLGMNAHINYDLAQSLLAVISEPEFDDPGLLAARHADHEHIDQVLVARVGAEDTELEALSGPAAAPTASSSPSTAWPPGGSCASPGPRSGPTPASWTPPAAPAPTPTPPAWPSWSAWPPPGSPT